MSKSSDGMFLHLSHDPIRFEPVSKVTNVFFDGTTKEVSHSMYSSYVGITTHE